MVIITHAYLPRSGIRYLPHGLKVYHIPVHPLPPTHVHATLPGFFTALPYVRNILLREQIDVLHAHASLSAEGMEGVFHARTLGVKVVFTDHSLFGLGNMAEIWGNKMLKGCLSDVEAVICVSHTGYVARRPVEAGRWDARPAKLGRVELTLAPRPAPPHAGRRTRSSGAHSTRRSCTSFPTPSLRPTSARPTPRRPCPTSVSRPPPDPAPPSRAIAQSHPPRPPR